MNLHLTHTELNLLCQFAPALHVQVTACKLVEKSHTLRNDYFCYDVPEALWNEALDRLENIEAELGI